MSSSRQVKAGVSVVSRSSAVTGQSRRTVPVLDQVRMARCVSPWATITRGPQLTSGDPSQSWGRSRHQLPSSELAHGETHVFPVVLNENKRLPARNVALSLIVFPFSVCEDNGVVPHIGKISSPALPTTGSWSGTQLRGPGESAAEGFILLPCLGNNDAPMTVIALSCREAVLPSQEPAKPPFLCR